jgi:hypothetical protein
MNRSRFIIIQYNAASSLALTTYKQVLVVEKSSRYDRCDEALVGRPQTWRKRNSWEI